MQEFYNLKTDMLVSKLNLEKSEIFLKCVLKTNTVKISTLFWCVGPITNCYIGTSDIFRYN